MKKILSLILLLTYNSLLFSQEKYSLIVGEWKVICIETNNYYYDSVTDSLSYSEEFKKMIPGLIKSSDHKDLVAFDEDTKKKTTSDKFVFEENGVYFRKKGTATIRKGDYTINQSEKTIYFKDKDKAQYSMEYFIKKGLLHLTINFKNPIHLKSGFVSLKPTRFILQKSTTSTSNLSVPVN